LDQSVDEAAHLGRQKFAFQVHDSDAILSLQDAGQDMHERAAFEQLGDENRWKHRDSGRRQNEPTFQRGPFVAGSPAAIEQMHRDYRAGLFDRTAAPL
jgi:hypothetical protein